MRPNMRSNLSWNGLAMLTLTDTHSIRMEENHASLVLMYCSNPSPMHSACFCLSYLWQFRMVYLAMLSLMSLHCNYSICCKIQLLWRLKACWLTYKIRLSQLKNPMEGLVMPFQEVCIVMHIVAWSWIQHNACLFQLFNALTAPASQAMFGFSYYHTCWRRLSTQDASLGIPWISS